MLFHERIYDLQRRFLRIIAVGLGAHEDLFESMLPVRLHPHPRHPLPADARRARRASRTCGPASTPTSTSSPPCRGPPRPGLQVKTDDGWVDAVAPEGQVIINTGMMLEVLSNGVIPPGIHRVVADPAYAGERYSVVQFCHPTPWTILAPAAVVLRRPTPRSATAPSRPATSSTRSSTRSTSSRTPDE